MREILRLGLGDEETDLFRQGHQCQIDEFTVLLRQIIETRFVCTYILVSQCLLFIDDLLHLLVT